MSTPAQIRRALDGLRQYFADRDGRPVELNETQVAVYLEALQSLDPTELEHAVRTWIRVGRFFPRVADLLAQITLDPHTAAQLAWSAVEKAVQSGGRYRSVTFANGAIGEAVKLTFGSWARACAFDFDGPGWAGRRSTFVSIFPTVRACAPVTLVGLHGATDDPYLVAPVAGLSTSTAPPRGELTDSEARALLANVERRALTGGR